MKSSKLPRDELFHHIFAILAYQFSEEFARAFLEPYSDMTMKFSRSTGKIREIYYQNTPQASYRPPFGTFSISLAAAKRILPLLPFPSHRVVVLTEVSEFIKAGKSVFAKHVVRVDPSSHVGDEVLVVDQSENLLAIGKLHLPPHYFPSMQQGSAVKVRKGINTLNK